MKKILFSLLALLFLFGLGSGLLAQEEAYRWYVRTMEIKVTFWEDGEQTTEYHEEYCLYFGNEKALETEAQLARSRRGFGAMVFHPVPKVAEDMSFQAPERWYVQPYDYSKRGTPKLYPLFEDRVWNNMPQDFKLVIMALDYKDDNLILIHMRGYTGTITICYHPRFEEDKKFYEAKLEQLLNYINNLEDPEKEIPNPVLPLKNII